MADKRTQRAQKKREKDKKKREVARQSRGPATQKAGKGLGSSAQLPVGECWVSDNWDQRGAQVAVAFSRMNAQGLGAVAFFECDLAEHGITEVSTFTRVTPGQVMGTAGQNGGERTMMEADPALAVKIAHTARGLGEVDGVSEAFVLFGDVRPEDCADEILTGPPEPKRPPKDGGIFGAIGRLFGIE
ncbi:MAG: hypothetical protein EP330_28840 [Deltaproteobacteria bacterium]|nr:MAG: hypothetical protein EP330_28840 [Deltaproteobacteria bacterium]